MRKMNLIASLCCLILMIVSVNQTFAAAQQGAVEKTSVAQESLLASKVDINNADETMLISIPGVGPATATRINNYREANGPFRSVDELLKIKGIGPKVLEKIRPFVTVS